MDHLSENCSQGHMTGIMGTSPSYQGYEETCHRGLGEMKCQIRHSGKLTNELKGWKKNHQVQIESIWMHFSMWTLHLSNQNVKIITGTPDG